MRPAWTDEEIISDYLGGVLAATGPSDDAGAAIVALIGRLSAEQLRLHYVLYREVRRLWPEMSTNLYEHQKADRAGVCIPIDEVVSALGSRTTNLASTMFALSHEDLVGSVWSVVFDADDPRYGVQARPSPLGAELFLWGHGAQGTVANNLFDNSLDLTFLTEVAPTPGSRLLTPPEPLPAS